jgi:soluble lytic murein transglycosylase-like protein
MMDSRFGKLSLLIGVIAQIAAGPLLAGSVSSSLGPTGSPDKTDLRRLVSSVSREYGVDPKLVDALVRVESAYDPRAISRRGAMGLMQLMPETASRLKVEDPFDPEENVRGGVKEFSRLVERYSGNLQLALAAYNAGEGAVSRYRGIPPYEETRTYVARIMTIYTGKPYKLAGPYRSAPVRMVQDSLGNTVITNVSGGSGSFKVDRTGSADGPLRGGFGASK